MAKRESAQAESALACAPVPRVSFTGNLRRHVDCASRDVAGATVADALAAVFAGNPPLRGYVLDDQGAVRRHVVIFVGDKPIQDRRALSDSVPAGAEITVMQALSGG
jgi:molybdopterin synthase sulfur carrier subunit